MTLLRPFCVSFPQGTFLFLNHNLGLTVMLLRLTNNSANTDATFSVEYSRERPVSEFSQALMGRTMPVHVPWYFSSINLPWSPQKLFTMAYRIYTEIPECSLLQITWTSPWLREDLSRDFSFFKRRSWFLFLRIPGAFIFRYSYYMLRNKEIISSLIQKAE